MTNSACVVQYTQFATKEDLIEVPAGECRAPYRCSQCKHRVKRTLPNPEKVGQAYTTNDCSRPNRQAQIKTHRWLQDETDRISGLHGRIAEIQLEDLSKKDRKERGADNASRYAVFVNDVRRNLDRALRD